MELAVLYMYVPMGYLTTCVYPGASSSVRHWFQEGTRRVVILGRGEVCRGGWGGEGRVKEEQEAEGGEGGEGMGEEGEGGTGGRGGREGEGMGGERRGGRGRKGEVEISSYVNLENSKREN